MVLDLKHYSKQIEKNSQGIWSGENSTEISYPKGGHAACMQVEDSSFWFRHRNQCIGQIVKNFPPQGPLWDIGGGNGFVTKFLQDFGVQSVLLEPGPDGAQNALSRGVHNVVCADISKTQFNSGAFSAVGLFDVIEHIEDEDAFLSRLNNLMKESGRLYLTTPAYSFLWSDEDVYAGHYRRYTKSNLIKVLKKNGFKVHFATYIFSILPIPIFFFRTIPYLIHKKVSEKSNVDGDHKTQDSLLKRAVLWLLSFENSFIRKNISFPFGGTILLVAEK